MAGCYNEVVIEVNDQNEISDYVLYSLGLMDQDELVENYNQLLAGNVDQIQTSEDATYTYDELLNTTFKLVNNSDLYHKVNGVWIDGSQDEAMSIRLWIKQQMLKLLGSSNQPILPYQRQQWAVCIIPHKCVII